MGDGVTWKDLHLSFPQLGTFVGGWDICVKRLGPRISDDSLSPFPHRSSITKPNTWAIGPHGAELKGPENSRSLD